jgi:hypothetical protein
MWDGLQLVTIGQTCIVMILSLDSVQYTHRELMRNCLHLTSTSRGLLSLTQLWRLVHLEVGMLCLTL